MTATSGNMFTYSFHFDDRSVDQNKIRIYGLDADNKSVCITINNFTTLVVIELPDRIRENGRWKDIIWGPRDALSKNYHYKEPLHDGQFPFPPKSRIKLLAQYICDKMGVAHSPSNFVFGYRKKLYSAQTKSGSKDNLFPVMYCMFAARKHVYTLKRVLAAPIRTNKLPAVRLKLHHANADDVMQLVSVRDLPTAGWIKYEGKSPRHQDTLANQEIVCDYTKIASSKSKFASKNVNPLIMSFDIEAYSHSPGKFPNADHPQDKVFMISCVFIRNSGDGVEREVLLTLGNPRDEDVGAECIRFKSEGSLIEGFSQIIQDENPQVITGWNILGFDIEYLIKRSKMTAAFDELALAGMHRTFGTREEKVIKWKSSAYKTQEFQYLEWEGRVIVDLLPFVRRDHKLDNYKLDTVGKHFLGGDGKEDLPVKELFKCYDIGIKVKSQVNEPYARTRVGMAGKYCMVDSRLVARLFRKTDAWIGLTEMATTCNVPMFDLIVRGQQKRVFAQVFKYCWWEKIIVESEGYRAAENEKYVGAHVFAPKPGVYDNIVPFDFASLYPTIIIAYNIDYSTLVSDPRIPNRECHIIEWEDHLGCEHDPKVRRVKELTLLIDAREKEMKKMRTNRDSLRLSDFIPGYKPKTKYGKKLRKAARCMVEREKKKINRKIAMMKVNLKPFREERADVKKGIPKMRMCASRKYRFLKKPRGVIPTVLQNLLNSRKETRTLKRKLEKELEGLGGKEAEELKVRINVLEQRQKAKKVCANSMYGAMGVREGYLPFMPGAMCTTAMGRRNNKLAAKTIVEKWGGELVYGDTDSEYIFFPSVRGDTHTETAALLWDHCLKVAADVTKLYPAPMKLEFEEEIYHRFLILSKKRYMYRMMKRDGLVHDKIGNKGVLLSRRDNSNVVRDLYEGLVQRVFNRTPLNEMLDWVFSQVLLMFQRTLSVEKFTITKAVGGVGTLPLLTDNEGIGRRWVHKIESGCGNESPEMIEKLKAGKVMVGDYTITALSKEPNERARQLKMKCAVDSIGYYTNSLPAHVALAMKMRARGVRVDDGTRLEHLVSMGASHTDKLFSKVEDVSYFKRHSGLLKIDFLYYLKAMTKPVDQVLNACFSNEPVAKHFMTKLYKHWIIRQKVVESMKSKPCLRFVEAK